MSKFDEGYNSYGINYIDDCPYEDGTENYNRWMEGYDEAHIGMYMYRAENKGKCLLEYRKALELISGPRDCGCYPKCECRTEENMKIEIEWMRDIAKEALKNGD